MVALTSHLSLVLSALSTLLLLSSLPSADAKEYTLYHRLSSSPSDSTLGVWTPRAHLTTSADAQADVKLEHVATAEDWKALKDFAVAETGRETRYELMLSETGTVGRDDEGVKTFVPLCHIRQSTPLLPGLFDTITLQLRNDTILSLSYTVQDIALDKRGCPVPSPAKAKQLEEKEKKERAKRKAGMVRLKRMGRDVSHLEAEEREREKRQSVPWRSEVVVRASEGMKNPTLRTPPPVSQDGKVIPPAPEKSFLQKYWMYIVPMLLVMMLPGGEESKDATGGAGQSAANTQQKSLGNGAKQVK